MRDFMIRGGAISVDHLAELHHAADDLVGAPAGTAGALATSPASSHHAGAGESRLRALDAVRDAMRAGVHHHIVVEETVAEALMLAARVYVHALWDQAVVLAAEEGPMPLVGIEAWVEPLKVYGARLQAMFPTVNLGVLNEGNLEVFGRHAGLPRARLVPVEG